MTKINEEMRKKQEGLTLGEKIVKSLEKLKSKNCINHITDSFFKVEIENDSRLYIRRHDLFTEGRCKDIPDEVLIA